MVDSMTFCVENITYDPRPDYPLVATVKRYWDPISQRQDGYTLIFAHGTGFHKEQWEPTLKHLFDLSKSSRAFPILEAWSIDCPNHGEAAILNEQVVSRGGYELICKLSSNHSISFLNTEQAHTILGPKACRYWAFYGCSIIVCTQSYPNPPIFNHLVLCEPMIAPTDAPKDDPSFLVGGLMTSAAEARRDIWPSKEKAFEILRFRAAFAKWDIEVLKIFVDHGMRELPTGVYLDKEGVTLSCPKLQEVACYRDSVSARRVYDFLPTLCSRIPVHVIWGAIDDAIHRKVKNLVTNAGSGRRVASIARVEGAGHLIVQHAPKRLAEAIFAAVAAAAHVEYKL